MFPEKGALNFRKACTIASEYSEEENISKAIIKVAIPAMLGQLTTLIYNIADTYFVSTTDSPAMIAAVTLCMPILLIIMSIAVIFGMGGGSIIARLLGEKKNKEASDVFTFANYTTVFAGILVLVLGLFFVKPIAVLSGADIQNMEFTIDYLKFIFIGAPFIMISNSFVHLFRSIGLIKQGTIGLMIGNGTNIILDFVFIVLMKQGTAGAALATSIGFTISSIYYFICLVKEEKNGNHLIRLSIKSYKAKTQMVINVISIGIPGALITVLMSISNIVLNNFIGIYGSDAVACYGIAYKIDSIPILLSVGLSQGVAPLIGYYYGANQISKKHTAMKKAISYGIILGAGFSVLFLTTGQFFSSLFMHTEPLITQTNHFLKILVITAPCLGIINMVSAYYQALGKAIKSLLITVLRNIALFIPGVIILNYLWQLNGVIAAQPIVEALLTIICILMYLPETRKTK